MHGICCIFIFLPRESDQSAITSSLKRVAGHLSITPRWGNPAISAFPDHATGKLAGLFSTLPFIAERQAGKLQIPI